MKKDLISDRARAAGLRTLKRAAGALTRLLPITPPVLLVGPGSALRLARAVADFGHRRVLLVTDGVITQLGLAVPVADALAAAGVHVVGFDGVTPDTPIPVVEQGLALYGAEKCEAIVAFGGGSVMDAAKVIALAAANQTHPRELVGYFKGRHGPAPVYAVPTTAGTGSEVTVAAIISDPESGQKMMVADSRLVPTMAALDPTLMTGLPPAVTAATGMDALTHAVEAFISLWATPDTDRMALAAVGMIWEHLPRAWRDGSDLVAREQMALASTFAGLAFTRANVGNVHAISHQLGARYHTPHGLANAIMLPPVLRFSLPAAAPRLARLARRIGLAGRTEPALAKRFVDAVQALNDALAIPRTLAALREEDFEGLVAAACHEADFNYPVPRRMTAADCKALLRQVLPAAAPPGAKLARAQRRPAASSKATISA
jgi:alcohol dehydrogenase class IV